MPDPRKPYQELTTSDQANTGQTHQKEPQEPQAAETSPQGENNIILADDANILQNETAQQTIARLQKYAMVAETRHLKIQWG